jgi:hypothetical protein
MREKLAIAVTACALIGALFGAYRWTRATMDAWAQGVETRVQGSVGAKIDKQQATLDRLMCATYYGKPQMVCDCEAVEAQQAKPNMVRCELVQQLLNEGRSVAAAAIAADSVPR